MKKIFNKVAGRIYESLVPNEETISRLAGRYVGDIYKTMNK